MKRNILIVGCMGHIGFSLTKYIASQKISVIGFYNNTFDKYKSNDLRRLNVKLFKNDLSNKKKINDYFKKIFSVQPIADGLADSPTLYSKYLITSIPIYYQHYKWY